MPAHLDDQQGRLPGEPTREEAQEQRDARDDLYRSLGIEAGWVLGVPEYIDGSPTPTVYLSWPRLPTLLDHHADDAVPTAAPDWRRKRVTVTARVYAWRLWTRGEPWPICPTSRYRDIPGVGTVEEVRYHLATVVASSPPEWVGSLSFDGGLQISEPRGAA